MGYLVCEFCKEEFILNSAENKENFDDECDECGGKLKYVEVIRISRKKKKEMIKNKKRANIVISDDSLIIKRYSLEDWEIPYSEVVEVRIVGHNFIIYTYNQKYDVITDINLSKLVDQINLKIKAFSFIKKPQLVEKIKENSEIRDYVKGFVNKSRYEYKTGDVDKFRELLVLKGNKFTNYEIRWLVEDELYKQEFENFKLEIIRNDTINFNNLSKSLIDRYGDNYKAYLELFIRLLEEKNISVDELEYKLENIKKEQDLYAFERDILEYNKESIDRDPMGSSIYEIDHEKSKNWLNIGNIYYDLKNTDKALICYNNALRFDPNNTEALNNKGLILQNFGEVDLASKCYKKALNIDPDNVEAWNNLGILLYDDNQTQKAALCYNRASRAKIDSKPILNLIKSLKLLGKAPNVIQNYQSFMENAIISDPTSLMEQIDPSTITELDPTSAIDILSQLFQE